MKLSTRGRYGLQAMIDMAIHSNGESIALYSIANRQDISTKYLEQMFTLLRKAELVRSIKGSQGGYTLAAKPSEITVGAILRALEGDIRIIDDSTNQSVNNSIPNLLKDAVWDKIDAAINQIVDTITLEDLVNDYKKRNIENTIMYYI
jgi:Rrf2 family protein